MVPKKLKARMGMWLVYCALIIIVLISLFPFAWLVVTSFKTRFLAFAIPPKWFFEPTFENYQGVYYLSSFPKYYLNSVVIALSSTALSILIGTPAGYSLARFKVRGASLAQSLILLTRMMPGIGIIIPFYMIWKSAGLLDTHLALIITYLTFNLSFVIWMTKGFIEEIPKDIEESAVVDGCTSFQVFYKISLPLVASGLAAIAIFCLILCWNEFMFALLLTGYTARTVPVGMTEFITHEAIRWGEMAAAGVSTAFPVIIFALIVQRQLVRGLTFGAVKG